MFFVDKNLNLYYYPVFKENTINHLFFMDKKLNLHYDYSPVFKEKTFIIRPN